jgi:aminoglycoside phosphotransferase (APT) family kinase protein
MAALLTKAAIGDDPNYYFNHGDFYPRNILVQVVDETNVRFTGILDWDNANFAPAFVAFDPPCWLWKFEEFTSGFLEGPNLRLGAAEEPQSIFDQEIKQVFEETVGREWLDVAYRKDAEVYRQIWQLMKEGVWSSVQLYLAEDAIEELTGAPYEQRLPRPTDEYVEDESDDEPDEVKERSTEHEVLHK